MAARMSYNPVMMWFKDPGVFIRVNYKEIVGTLEFVCERMGVADPDQVNEFRQEYFLRLLNGRYKHDPNRRSKAGRVSSVSSFVYQTVVWLITEKKFNDRVEAGVIHKPSGTVCFQTYSDYLAQLARVNEDDPYEEVQLSWFEKRMRKSLCKSYRELSVDDCIQIFRRIVDGWEQKDLAKEFKVTVMAISLVLKRIRNLYTKIEGDHKWKSPSNVRHATAPCLSAQSLRALKTMYLDKYPPKPESSSLEVPAQLLAA